MKKGTEIRKGLTVMILAAIFIAAIPLLGMAADGVESGNQEISAQESVPAAALQPEGSEEPSSFQGPASTEPAAPSPEEESPASTEPGPTLAREPEALPEPSQAADPALDGISIGTADELAAFAQAVNGGTCEQAYGVPAEQIKVTLTADIDLSGSEFTPIGSGQHPFAGLFDGAGYTISNLSASADMGAGLLGVTDGAQICNVNVTAAHVSARTMAGGIAGYAMDTEISNCTASGSVYAEENIAGGIAGALTGGSITRCRVQDAAVTAIESAGGIAGFAAESMDSPCRITDCESGAAITGDWFSGGVAGTLGAAAVENCYFTGSLEIGGGDSGLIAGWAIDGGAVDGCSSSARIAGDGSYESGAQVGSTEQ